MTGHITEILERRRRAEEREQGGCDPGCVLAAILAVAVVFTLWLL